MQSNCNSRVGCDQKGGCYRGHSDNNNSGFSGRGRCSSQSHGIRFGREMGRGSRQAMSKHWGNPYQTVRIEGGQYCCLITNYNDLGGGRFADPRIKKSFHYDHERKEASDYQDWSPNISIEPLRFAIEVEVTAYTLSHYKYGICNAFSVDDNGNAVVVICIEDNQFQPQSCLNGRWRSVWTINKEDAVATITGVLMMKLDGGQISTKSISKGLSKSILNSSNEKLAKELISRMSKAETIEKKRHVKKFLEEQNLTTMQES